MNEWNNEDYLIFILPQCQGFAEHFMIWCTTHIANLSGHVVVWWGRPYVNVITDYTELFIQTPFHFRVQSETYSSYKNHNTAKELTEISINGFTRFVSDLAPGRMPHKDITKNRDMIDLPSEGDSVMTDKGFV